MYYYYHRLGDNPNLLYKPWQISTPQGAKTPEPILMKRGMVDYVWESHPT